MGLTQHVWPWDSQPQEVVGPAVELGPDALLWSAVNPSLLLGAASPAGSDASGTMRIGTPGIGRSWTRTANAGSLFGTFQHVTGLEITVAVVAAPVASIERKVAWSQRTSGSSAAQFLLGFNIEGGSSANVLSGGIGLISRNTAASGGGVGAASQCDGLPHAWVLANGANEGYVYRDGVLQTVSPNNRASGTVWTSAQVTRIGNIGDYASDGSFVCNDPIYLVIVWPRVLPADQARDLSQALATNLGSAFEAQRIWVPVSAGGSTTTVSTGVGEATANGAAAGIVLGTVVPAGVGAATAQGSAAAVNLATAVSAGVGSSAAAGAAAGVAITTNVQAGVGQAAATGASASVVVATTLTVNTGEAVAAGLGAAVAVSTAVAAGTGASTAAGLSALITTAAAVQAGTGVAAAAGLAATVTTASAVISGGVGQATAAGAAAVIAETTRVAAGIGQAPAAGAAATISPYILVPAGAGAATAAGLSAQLTAATTIVAGAGAASATGLAAAVGETARVQAGVGAATAAGAQATVDAGSTRVQAAAGVADAAGAQASIFTATRVLAGTGAAAGEGLPAAVLQATAVAGGVALALADGSVAVVRTGLSIEANVGVAQAIGLGALVAGAGHIAKGSLGEVIIVAPVDNTVYVPYEDRTIHAR